MSTTAYVDGAGRRLITADEAGQVLHLSASWVRMLGRQGLLDRVLVGQTYLYPEASVWRYLAGTPRKLREARQMGRTRPAEDRRDRGEVRGSYGQRVALTRLRELRQSAGLSRADLAKLAEVHENTIAFAENHRHKTIMHTARKIASALGVEVERIGEVVPAAPRYFRPSLSRAS